MFSPKKVVVYFFFLTLLLPYPGRSSDNATLDSLLKVYAQDSLHASPILLNRIGGQYYSVYTYEGYNQALRFHQKALKVVLRENDPRGIAWTYRLIAAVYDATNMNLDTAALYYQRFLEYQLSTNDSLGIIDAYRNVMVIMEKNGNREANSEFAEKLYDYLKNYYGESSQRYKNQLAVFYAKKKNIKKAKTLFGKIDLGFESKEDTEGFRNYYFAGHFIYQNEKKYKEAISLLNEALPYATLTIDSISIYKFLSEHYFQLEDYKNAFVCLEENSVLSNKYEREINRNKIAETVTFYQNEQKENERIALEEKSRSETKIKNYALIVMMLLTLVVVIIAYAATQTSKRNKLLRSQKEEVERLNRLNQKIFSVISHDFSGPLLSMNLLMTVLKNEEYNKEEIDEYVSDISNQITQSKLILENLLSWAQAELKMEPFSTGSVHCQPFIIANEIIAQLKPGMELKKLSIKNSIHENLEIIILPDILKIIFRNLLSNATKFSFTNGTIEIGFDPERKTIFVKDDGTGMDEKKSKLLFYRAVGNTLGTSNETGFGLGLYITNELVHKSGGKIFIQSELNKGTTFSISLPIYEHN